ncbi:hypothetical protein Q3G72_012647 [Acer saccharum]|nr:hypothetical protein Q3G72_012647 [Acer saccharum]
MVPRFHLLCKRRYSLEQLKEQPRKKQEMLDQKQNDFRRKLDKLEKQILRPGHLLLQNILKAFKPVHVLNYLR